MIKENEVNVYVKKPVEVQAIKWDGANIKAVMDFMDWRNADHDKARGLVIHTLGGSHKADVGDFILKGVKGEFYPCKPHIHKLTYDIL